MSKPNCYKCIHRGTVTGDAHSCCNHPKVKSIKDDPLLVLASMLGGRGRSEPSGTKELGIKANQHGISKGWFNFPLNFDPVWLEECNGMEEK